MLCCQARLQALQKDFLMHARIGVLSALNRNMERVLYAPKRRAFSVHMLFSRLVN
jgi:hypothetical protein